MCDVRVENSNGVAGSKTTTSASMPGAIEPLRASPKRLAIAVEVTSTSSEGVISPASTPRSQSFTSRCWIIARPFGIFEKSPRPSAFCSLLNGQWSVETLSRTPRVSASHSNWWLRSWRTGGQGAPHELVDDPAVLGVDHRQRAEVARALEHAEEQVVGDHQHAAVGEEHLERADALGDDRLHVGERALVGLGDRHVEAVVDVSRAGRALLPLL